MIPGGCRWGTVLVAAALGCTAQAARSGSYGGDTVFVEDFESGTLAAWADGVDLTRQRVVNDPAFAQSGNRYLEVAYVAAGDGGWLTRFIAPAKESLYVSFYVRFPAAWQGGTKLVALYGSRTDDRWSGLGKAGTCPNGSDFFATMIVTEAGGDAGPARFYTYYPGMAREPDGATCWGRFGDGSETYVPPLSFARDVWHRVEFRVKLNTPGQNDASQTFWVDGVQRGTWSGFSIRSSDVLQLNAVQLTFNRGVAGGPRAQKLYVDNLVVSTSRPGP